MRIFGKGFNYAQDGPGNRLVYHLSGCNMHCLWCSNPEGMDAAAGKEVSVSALVEECIRSRFKVDNIKVLHNFLKKQLFSDS